MLFGDWAYYCTPALSEMLKLPRVTVSNIPILDPVHTTWDRSTGRRMHASNMLAYTPQVHPKSDPLYLFPFLFTCMHIRRVEARGMFLIQAVWLSEQP